MTKQNKKSTHTEVFLTTKTCNFLKLRHQKDVVRASYVINLKRIKLIIITYAHLHPEK